MEAEETQYLENRWVAHKAPLQESSRGHSRRDVIQKREKEDACPWMRSFIAIDIWRAKEEAITIDPGRIAARD